MTEVLDMNMNDLFGEDSDLLDNLQECLSDLNVDIDNESLAVILHEYEIVKMEFLKNHIMKMLEARGDILDNGPVKVVVSQNGMDFESLDQDDDFIDTTMIS